MGNKLWKIETNGLLDNITQVTIVYTLYHNLKNKEFSIPLPYHEKLFRSNSGSNNGEWDTFIFDQT